MPHQIILCIVHLLIWCTAIFLLIAILSLIKSKLNIFVIIFYQNSRFQFVKKKKKFQFSFSFSLHELFVQGRCSSSLSLLDPIYAFSQSHRFIASSKFQTTWILILIWEFGNMFSILNEKIGFHVGL